MPDPMSAQRGMRPSRRRSFTIAYKLGVLLRAAEARAAGRGRVLQFLREEGLRTSHLAEWRKQFSAGRGSGKAGRPPDDAARLRVEMRRMRRRLAALEHRCRAAERMLVLQRKYVVAASLRLQRKDRGLLSALLAQVEDAVPLTVACRALGLSRRDFYRTIKPLREEAEGREARRAPRLAEISC